MEEHLNILLTILGSSELDEEQKLASKIKKELDTTIKSFVRTSRRQIWKSISKISQRCKK